VNRRVFSGQGKVRSDVRESPRRSILRTAEKPRSLRSYVPRLPQLENDWRERYETPERWVNYGLQIRTVIESTPESVLEVGPGTGTVSGLLRGRGLNVTTLDVDPRFEPDIVGSVHELTRHVPPKSFDTVLCAEVLEHLPFDLLETCCQPRLSCACRGGATGRLRSACQSCRTGRGRPPIITGPLISGPILLRGSATRSARRSPCRASDRTSSIRCTSYLYVGRGEPHVTRRKQRQLDSISACSHRLRRDAGSCLPGGAEPRSGGTERARPVPSCLRRPSIPAGGAADALRRTAFGVISRRRA